MTYVIQITPTALEMIKGVRDRRVNDLIKKGIDQLSKDPDKQGKALHGDLWGYRCVRAVGQRYSTLYRVEGAAIMVLVVAVGIRREEDKKDIYELAQKMIRLGLIDPIAEK